MNDFTDNGSKESVLFLILIFKGYRRRQNSLGESDCTSTTRESYVLTYKNEEIRTSIYNCDWQGSDYLKQQLDLFKKN